MVIIFYGCDDYRQDNYSVLNQPLLQTSKDQFVSIMENSLDILQYSSQGCAVNSLSLAESVT
jgi:hypothetical protein